jgi:drug/metabolite transporter superfamily protein YnfA
MENTKKEFLLITLSISFMAFFIEVLMLIIYYPAPIAPLNIPKIVYTIVYYLSLFIFGILLAHSSRYGKSFVWMFGIFIFVSLILSYLFSNISYLFMGNNLGAQLGEFKNLMPKIIPLTIFINIPILIFGYSVSFIIHSIHGRYNINNSKNAGDRKVFWLTIIIMMVAIGLFLPTIYNINDIGSYWNKVIYKISLIGKGNSSEIKMYISNKLNDKIEIINVYIPVYINKSEVESIGMKSFGSSITVEKNSDKILTVKVNRPSNTLRIGRSYIKFLYKGKLLRKDS